MKWNPPETASKDGAAFLITTAGPNMDIAWWDGNCFRDYHYKQKIAALWPYMIGWSPLPDPAIIKDTEAETRAANGWPSLTTPDTTTESEYD